MNLFPYNSGHLLVCPYHHVFYYMDLNEEERIEFSELTAQAMLVKKETAQPQGLNIGMNQGEIADVDIAARLHRHITPRWLGDVNFPPIITRTKAVPELPEDVRSRLAAAWPKEK